MLQVSSKPQTMPIWEPGPQPIEPSLPEWKNPDNFPKVPSKPFLPAIHPTDPWPDPEPKRDPKK
jgi:hypothetical protein